MKRIGLCLVILMATGCATITNDHCKNAASPASCTAKFTLGVMSCENEASRKTPVTKVATGNYLCDGGGSGSIQSGGQVSISTSSKCRPEFKNTRDQAIWSAHRNACIQAKMDEGRFK